MVTTGRGGSGNIVPDGEAMSTLVNHDDDARERITKTESRDMTKTESRDRDRITKTESNDRNDKKVFYSTGRGGAGNFHKLDTIPLPKLVPQGSNTPSILTNKFTTGRGGYGNMVENDDPKLTRKLQDVDAKPTPKENDLYAVASNKSFLVGRGGFGNVVSANSEGSGNNLYTVVSQGESKGEKEKKHEKGFFHKVKSLFS